MLNSDKELNCFLQMTINLMSTFITPLLSLLPVCCSLLQIEPDMTNTISYWFQSPPSIQNLVNCFSIRKSLWVVAIGNHRPLLEDTSEIHQDIQSPCRHRGGQKRLKNVSERACDTLLMEWKLDGAEKKKPQGTGDMEKFSLENLILFTQFHPFRAATMVVISTGFCINRYLLTVDFSRSPVHLCMRSATLTTIAPGRGGAGTYSEHPRGKTCQKELN